MTYELKRDDDSREATTAFAVPRVYKFLIGPGDTRKGTDLEIFLSIPHPRRLQTKGLTEWGSYGIYH